MRKLFAGLMLTVLAIAPMANAQTAAPAAVRTTASPGTEAALRRQIEGWANKQPAFDDMTPAFANAMRPAQVPLQAQMDRQGALKSITFKEVNPQGWDVYLVTFAASQMVWSIGPLSADGKISAMNFVSVVPRDGTNTASPGTEAALRKYVESLQNGQPAYDMLQPNLANIVRQQMRLTLPTTLALGALKSLTFKNVNLQGLDVYEAVYQNGRQTFNIAPLMTDGKIGNLQMAASQVTPSATSSVTSSASNSADPVKAYIDTQARAQKTISDSQVASFASTLFNDAGSAVLGNPNGDVTIVEFFDYNCPFSRAVEPRVEALLKSDPNVRLILKEFTIEPVESSPPAARAALAAMKQGKYDAYHIAMMRTTGHTLTMQEIFDDATSAGLDVDQLKKDMEAPAIYSQIISNFNLARALRIFQTPTFVINGHVVTDPSAQIDFPKLVAEARAK